MRGVTRERIVTIARISQSRRATMRHHGQPGGGNRKQTKNEGPRAPPPHGTLYAPLRAPASDFHRSASHPTGLQGALEAQTAARQHGDRRAARSSKSHESGGRGTLLRHRQGCACRTKGTPTPRFLRSANRGNATVHPSTREGTTELRREAPGFTRKSHPLSARRARR